MNQSQFFQGLGENTRSLLPEKKNTAPRLFKIWSD